MEPVFPVKVAIKTIEELGFLEPTGDTYKVRTLYHDGLEVTQGKAFQTAQAT